MTPLYRTMQPNPIHQISPALVAVPEIAWEPSRRYTTSGYISIDYMKSASTAVLDAAAHISPPVSSWKVLPSELRESFQKTVSLARGN